MVALKWQRDSKDMWLRSNRQRLVLLAVGIGLSIFYLIRSLKECGIAGGVLFLVIWVMVLLWQFRRSKKV